MTIDHDPDPEATVKMPRPAIPKDADLEDIDPDSTLIRDDWGNATIQPPGTGTSAAPAEQSSNDPAKPEWEATLRRPAYAADRDPR